MLGGDKTYVIFVSQWSFPAGGSSILGAVPSAHILGGFFRCLVANALRPWCCWAPVQSFCEGFWLTLLRWSFLVLSEITFLLYLVHTNAFSCSVSLLESSWFILFYYHPQPTFLTKGSVTRIRPPSSLVKPHRQEKGCFLLDTDRPGLKDLLPHHDNMGQHSMLDCLTQMSTWPGPEPLDT